MHIHDGTEQEIVRELQPTDRPTDPSAGAKLDWGPSHASEAPPLRTSARIWQLMPCRRLLCPVRLVLRLGGRYVTFGLVLLSPALIIAKRKGGKLLVRPFSSTICFIRDAS